VQISISRFVTSGLPATSFNLSNYINNQVGEYDAKKITVKIINDTDVSGPGQGRSGSGGFEFQDMLLSSLSYNYDVQGFFTEELTYTGHISNLSSGFIGKFTIRTSDDTGNVYRRQDFGGVSLPSPIPANPVIQSVSASMNINYGEVPSWGNFYTIKNKYLMFPVDVSCSITILDLGFSQSEDGFSTDLNGDTIIDDSVDEVAMAITGPPNVNLGSKNFFTGFERNGGAAGNNDYATITYNFKNNNNYFSVS
jgi:hypothetical protein